MTLLLLRYLYRARQPNNSNRRINPTFSQYTVPLQDDIEEVIYSEGEVFDGDLYLDLDGTQMTLCNKREKRSL